MVWVRSRCLHLKYCTLLLHCCCSCTVAVTIVIFDAGTKDGAKTAVARGAGFADEELAWRESGAAVTKYLVEGDHSTRSACPLQIPFRSSSSSSVYPTVFGWGLWCIRIASSNVDPYNVFRAFCTYLCMRRTPTTLPHFCLFGDIGTQKACLKAKLLTYRICF